jgi:hypothetical protein
MLPDTTQKKLRLPRIFFVRCSRGLLSGTAYSNCRLSSAQCVGYAADDTSVSSLPTESAARRAQVVRRIAEFLRHCDTAKSACGWPAASGAAV